MKFKTLAFGLLLCLFSVSAMVENGHTHGGGGHKPSAPVSQATAIERAIKIVDGLVMRDQLDKSWASTTASSIDKKVISGNQAWVVVFINDKITDTKKRKLYIFLTLGGDYAGANHIGE